MGWEVDSSLGNYTFQIFPDSKALGFRSFFLAFEQSSPGRLNRATCPGCCGKGGPMSFSLRPPFAGRQWGAVSKNDDNVKTVKIERSKPVAGFYDLLFVIMTKLDVFIFLLIFLRCIFDRFRCWGSCHDWPLCVIWADDPKYLATVVPFFELLSLDDHPHLRLGF